MGNKFINLPVINSTSSTGTERFQLYRSEKILRLSFQKSIPAKYSGTSLLWHLYSGNTTIPWKQRCSWKNVHITFVSVTPSKGHLYSGEMDLFLRIQRLVLTTHTNLHAKPRRTSLTLPQVFCPLATLKR